MLTLFALLHFLKGSASFSKYWSELLFYRAQERKVGPDGFLDSSRYTHTFVIRKEKEDKSVGRSKPRALSDISSHPNVVSLAAKIEKDERDYQRRVKVVEVIHDFFFSENSL